MIPEHLHGPETLRLIWPQWQGAGKENASTLLPGVPEQKARRAYAAGTRVIRSLLPEPAGREITVPVDMDSDEAIVTGGIESREAISDGLRAASDILRDYSPARVLTVGGDCAVSVAPFSYLAECYGEDLAVVWIDAHPDCDTPDTAYNGFHAMAVAQLIGCGDPDIASILPATVAPASVMIAGLHDWEEDAYENVGTWDLATLTPDELRGSSDALQEWLRSTGAGKIAVHLDVDVVDSDEVPLGLGQVPGGLSIADVKRVLSDLDAEWDIVGLTLAEFIPRQLLALEELLGGEF